MAALSYHTWDLRSSCRWYLAGAGILWVVLSVAAGAHAILIKKQLGCAWPAVTVQPFHELLRIEITVPAHWALQPGQWVYLWLPHAGFRTCFQLPLFYVSFWDDTPKQRTLYILVRPKSVSLYQRLYMRESLHGRQRFALLLGPYGRSLDFTAFGTILFIVEDTAIVRVLPFIRMLVLASEQRRAMVRKLRIVWQMDDFTDWMQELLDLDRGEFKILRFSLYYRLNSTTDNPDDMRGGRIKLCPGSMKAGQVAQHHLNKRRGKLAVGGQSEKWSNLRQGLT
ncbi:hypothetical protein Asppvi_002035 [Aspergillus pseudoviridinutans]|uniref:FAD-binding FR-type domain-containing protein n=1 Tax=Aspergillus pseudoviridinutans TaxID=1517512 RepID=A0A9P3BKG5_9EURO|nr:uncharacterized protein Asppvi_002035 [Aspergillus pseudoviridinutans]GIJ92757.1 hypothetical protein Asppvi_002035 [Aspergillus pseudoviridinutans]